MADDASFQTSRRTLLKLAEGILKFARTDKCLVKPGSWLVERLIAGLELDGYELRDGDVVVREANVFDVEEQSERRSCGHRSILRLRTRGAA